MSINNNFDGFDKLKKNLESLDGSHEIPIEELFDSEFMSACSDFNNFEDFLEGSGFKVSSMNNFERIPELEWESYVSLKTSYKSWDEMLESAISKYIEKGLIGGL